MPEFNDGSQNTNDYSDTYTNDDSVSDDGWNESSLEQNDRPAINGVALADVPEFDDESQNTNQYRDTDTDDNSGQDSRSTTELDPLGDENSFQFADENQLVQAQVIDAITGNQLNEADLQLYVDSPNQALDYQIQDGILTFEANPNDNYIIVASHEDYQDQFMNLSGEELLAQNDKTVDFELEQLDDMDRQNKNNVRSSTKFKAMVRDEETGAQLQDAEIKFFVDGKAIESEYSKENGKTVFKSPAGEDYMMLVSRKGYQDLIYHLPGAPEDNMDVDLAMLREDDTPYSPYRLLAVKGQAFDDFNGENLDGVTFEIFENGDLIETTDNLATLEADPTKDYKIVASKDGYHQGLQSISAAQLSGNEPIELPFAMRKEQISEATGSPIFEDAGDDAIPINAFVVDITDDQPLSEAMVLVFADDIIQDQVNTWESGMVTINAAPGKEYQLLVRKDGYNDKIIDLGTVVTGNEGLEIALVPQDIQKLRPSGIDITNANMLVMAGPDGREQLYLSTEDELYQYSVENGNQYLTNDNQKILLKERSRSLDGKVTTKQDSDQFNLRAEDQFLYDELSADEKAMVDQVVNKMKLGQLDEDPDLKVYYHNLPEEYRNLVNHLAASVNDIEIIEEPLLVNSDSFNRVLSENQIGVVKVFNVNNIYYDFDKSNIREDAAAELDKLISILKSNKNIKVMMFSHTDSRGSNNYNNGLSNKRGKSAVQYLVDRGISLDRLTTQGRGETQPVNSCMDTIKCSEEAHQLNRRTEFILSV